MHIRHHRDHADVTGFDFKGLLLYEVAFLKTGTLSDTRALAGYVRSRSGTVYAVTAIVNHPEAARARCTRCLHRLGRQERVSGRLCGQGVEAKPVCGWRRCSVRLSRSSPPARP